MDLIAGSGQDRRFPTAASVGKLTDSLTSSPEASEFDHCRCVTMAVSDLPLSVLTAIRMRYPKRVARMTVATQLTFLLSLHETSLGAVLIPSRTPV
jgi:hypothetical protein